MKYNFLVDEDTVIVLGLISRYLRKYFNHDDDDEIVIVINRFYSKMKPFFSEQSESDFLDLNFHHDHPFSVAGRIHYHNDAVLQQRYIDVVSWLRDINWFNVPMEAQLDYHVWSSLDAENNQD